MKTMKVLLIDWNAYGNDAIEGIFLMRGYDIRKVSYNGHLKGSEQTKALQEFKDCLNSFSPDYVFSFHYFPNISDSCEESDITYISWIYDSPVFDLYSPTVLNHVNRIFVFDRGIYEEFSSGGIPTVHYMPLGVVTHDLPTLYDATQNSITGPNASPENTRYISDISFVGSMYTEPKHRLYDRFSDISPYAHGYLDAIIESQKHVYGVNFLEQLINPKIEEEMQNAYPTDPNARNIMSPAKQYSQFVLSRQVTAIERKEILKLLGNYALSCDHSHYQDMRSPSVIMESDPLLKINLFTHDTSLNIPGVINNGPVNYGDDMYRVFALSKINLNITLRSILTGIPLRAFDIMSCGGFLLSNYQEELCEFFIPGEDFDYYEDYEDLMTKIEYYLSHDKERQGMAQNAQEKVRNDHSLDSRIDAMETYL